jgi:hypothetical protein
VRQSNIFQALSTEKLMVAKADELAFDARRSDGRRTLKFHQLRNQKNQTALSVRVLLKGMQHDEKVGHRHCGGCDARRSDHRSRGGARFWL